MFVCPLSIIMMPQPPNKIQHDYITPHPGGKPSKVFQSLYRLLVRYARRGWPLFVTENGVADGRDAQRADFLRAHLYAVDRARAEGIDVIGYLHWSLIDNFEWSHGFRGRFGLFSVDFNDPTLARRPTAAVAVFQEAARNLGTLH